MGRFDAETEDVGTAGCRIASPRLVHRGEPIQLQLAHDNLSEGLKVSARVAWTSGERPWLLGIAFDPSARSVAGPWFERLLGSIPGLPLTGRLPARIPLSSMIYLLKPPRTPVDFTADELELLRAVGSGASASMLRERFGERWPAIQLALFALLAGQCLTMQRGASVHPLAWKGVLGEPMTVSMRVAGARPARSSPEPSVTPPPADLTPTALPVDSDAWGRSPGRSRSRSISLEMETRSAEVESLYSRALEKLSRGQLAGARLLLQRAAEIAPADAGIAAALRRASEKS